MTQALATDNLEQKRWWIAIAAFIIQLCLGTIYAWSVVKNELVANQGWAEVPTSVTFMIAIAVIVHVWFPADCGSGCFVIFAKVACGAGAGNVCLRCKARNGTVAMWFDRRNE